MPLDGTPRSLPLVIFTPPGRVDLCFATGQISSLAVYPAAGLIDYYRGNKLVLVNKSPTPADRRADLVIHAPIGEVFSQL